MKCDSCPYLTKYDNNIFETNYWKIDLSNDQAYLGRSYITLKRHCGSLSELTKDEWSDLNQVIKRLDKMYKKTFGAKLLNFNCLMNNAYQAKSPNPHVHWHVRPRYDRKVKFEGITFKDLEFGHHYARGNQKEQILPEEALIKIIKKLKKNL